ncbi:MAG TPA: hypothetical protein VGP26_23850 [Actinophytocola sp.]|jgi:hypothetical protein|nr:hypothetical protein [Actinophytocola sp.]
MGEQTNKISVGGSVGGSVVAGNHNVVGTAALAEAGTPERPAPAAGHTPRIGFVVDVVGFGRRSAADKDHVQLRLDTVVRQVLADLGIGIGDTESTVAGDSKVVFLPVGADSSGMLPGMITSMSTRLRQDNARHRDRLRLRMAVATGLLGQEGPLGRTGELIVDLHRLVDSAPTRQAIDRHVGADLAILVSRTLHDEVIRPGFLDVTDFVRVDVEMKEFRAAAWLRVC